MDPLLLGALGFAALFALIALKVPIGIAMALVGLVGYATQSSFGPALTLLTGDPVSFLSSVDFATVPLFLLMGTFVGAAGFSKDIYAVAAAFLGHRRGGLSYATITGSATFGAVCGSSTATVATFTKIALPEMLKRGYSEGLASGTIAAGGTLKSLIPPSLVMILYCIVAKTFIIDLFLAAVVPAVLTILLNFAAIAITVRLNPKAAPVSEQMPWSGRLAALRQAAPALTLLTAVFGGLYSGIFTVNEAASVAAILSLLFAIVRKRLNWETMSQSLVDAAGVSVMLYVIVFGASIFTYFMTLTHVPDAIVGTVDQAGLSPLATVVLLVVVYIVLGTVFDEIAAIVVTLPFALPIVVNAGYDPLWWGVIMAMQVELALIHPPFGILVFLLHGMAPQIPMRRIYYGVAPFLIADFTALVTLTLFPNIALWLPRLLAT
ncbi:TRAP transporter large permease [Azospirillum melinis]